MILSPSERDPIKAADWIELQCLYSIGKSVSLERLRSQINLDASLNEEIEEEVSDLDLTLGWPDEASERLLAAAANEIERRALLLKGSYPFLFADGRLRATSIDEHNWNPYLFCLLVADREFYSPADQLSPVLFEHLACDALAAHLSGEAVRFGTPRDSMPTGVHDALSELSRLTGNRRISEGFPVNATDNDLGLDVAGWKAFPDGQRNKLEIYMQCATGENWSGKRNEPNLEIWRQILSWSIYPTKAMAIPYVASEDDWGREALGLLLMDRLRLAAALAHEDLSDPKWGWPEWCHERILIGNQVYNLSG